MNQTFGPLTYRSQPFSPPSSICSNDSQDQSDKSDIESTDEDDSTVVDTLFHVTRPNPSPPQWNNFPPTGTTSKAEASRPTFSKSRLPFFPLQALYPRVSALLSRSQLDVNQRLRFDDLAIPPKNLVGDQVIDIYSDTSPLPSILNLVPTSWKDSGFETQGGVEIGAQFLQANRTKPTTSPRDSKPTKCNDLPLHRDYDPSQTLAHIKERGDTRDLPTPQVPDSQYPLPPRASVLAPSPRATAFASPAATPAPSTQPSTASHSTITPGQTLVTTLHSVPGAYIPKRLWACPWWKKDPIGHHNCRTYKVERIDSVMRHHATEKHADDLTPEIVKRLNAIGRQPSAEARWKASYMAIHGDGSANVPSCYWTESIHDLEVREVINRTVTSARVGGLTPEQFMLQIQELAHEELQDSLEMAHSRYARMLSTALTRAPSLGYEGHNATQSGLVPPPSEPAINSYFPEDSIPNSYIVNEVPYVVNIPSSSMEHPAPFPDYLQESPFVPLYQDFMDWLTGTDGFQHSVFSPQLGQSAPSYVAPAEVQRSENNAMGFGDLTPPSTQRSDSSGDPKAPSPDSGYVSERNVG